MRYADRLGATETLGFISSFEAQLVFCAQLVYKSIATAFRQLKRTVVVPTRMVRAWSEQPNFQC
jgi:hypothetical protein